MNNLKKFRKEKNLTQVQMANLLKITQAEYSNYENEKREMSISKALQLAKILNTTIDALFNIT